jgi:hypothetical protein
MYNDIDNILMQSGVEDCCGRMKHICSCSHGDGPQAVHNCKRDDDDKCPKHKWGLTDYPLASVYAPIQEFEQLYDLDTALKRGTVFEKLDLPFMGESVHKGGNCRG